VVDKIMRDFAERGVAMSRRQILEQLSKDQQFVTTRFASAA
jgi:hypothetical protein